MNDHQVSYIGDDMGYSPAAKLPISDALLLESLPACP
jgi:hypothetical protein